jgi:hypothetical protein
VLWMLWPESNICGRPTRLFAQRVVKIVTGNYREAVFWCPRFAVFTVHQEQFLTTLEGFVEARRLTGGKGVKYPGIISTRLRKP